MCANAIRIFYRLGDQDSNLSWRSQNPLFYQLNYPPVLDAFYHNALDNYCSFSSFMALLMRWSVTCLPRISNVSKSGGLTLCPDTATLTGDSN